MEDGAAYWAWAAVEVVGCTLGGTVEAGAFGLRPRDEGLEVETVVLDLGADVGVDERPPAAAAVVEELRDALSERGGLDLDTRPTASNATRSTTSATVMIVGHLPFGLESPLPDSCR